ncbi:MAG: hypothetical protein ACXAEI_12540 [Candidatus Hodarchaeales archaeon]
MKNGTPILFIIVLLLITPITIRKGEPQSGNAPLPQYWYSFESFKINNEDIWVPFFSDIDVPFSIPLRGYNSMSRNYFIDLGALDWFSAWIEYTYGLEVSPYEKNFNDSIALDQLKYLFSVMTERLDSNGASLAYLENLTIPFEAWVPLIVMYDFPDDYDDARMQEWIIHPDIIEEKLNAFFPLIKWETDLFWFDYSNATAFATLAANKTQGHNLVIDADFLNRSDEILNEILSANPRYGDYDLIFPSLLLLQEPLLYWAERGFNIGGLSRLSSSYPEITSWSLNGRGKYSYFSGGDPTKPRDSLTTTVLHELGLCIGQTNIYNIFRPDSTWNYSWILCSSTVSDMGPYSRSVFFDRFDRDLILNGQLLQLWGRYRDEIAYFNAQSLNSTQLEALTALESELLTIPELLSIPKVEELQMILTDAEATFNELSGVLNISRKLDSWTAKSPGLDVQVDYIIGPNIPSSKLLASKLQLEGEFQGEIFLDPNTTLPAPVYNLQTTVYATNDSYNNDLIQFWGDQLVQSRTSNFDASRVPADAWDSYPRNRLFQLQHGYAIDGHAVEEWLSAHPYSDDVTDKLHYRFYLIDLQNLTNVVFSSAANGEGGNPAENDSGVSSFGWSLALMAFMILITRFKKKRNNQKETFY